jgi:hypothetical protein
MVEAYGTGYGAWLMHSLVQVWCMVDARFGTCCDACMFGTGVGAWLMHLLWYGCGTWLMLGMVHG